MITISTKEFERLCHDHPDYISRCLITHEFNGKTCKRGEWMAFESVLTGDLSKGTALIFEHIHFEIV